MDITFSGRIEVFLKKVSRDQFARLWKQGVPGLLKAIHAKAKLNEVILATEEEPSYREIYEKWDRFTVDEMREAWEKTNSLLTKVAYATRPYCVRCGDCCKHNSPILYEEDLPLLVKGALKTKDIFTLRIGEIGYSPQEGRTVVLAEEMVKIKETGGEGPCIFYKHKACSIYENRPLQCQTLECWNPESYEVLSSKKPLNRKAILTVEHLFWKVISAHEKRSSHETLSSILEKGQPLDPTAEEKAQDIIFYDLHTRMFMEEKVDMKKEEMDFFFGRPLTHTLFAYGYWLEGESGQHTRIVKKGKETTSKP